jgi:hypothetical protein
LRLSSLCRYQQAKCVRREGKPPEIASLAASYPESRRPPPVIGAENRYYEPALSAILHPSAWMGDRSGKCGFTVFCIEKTSAIDIFDGENESRSLHDPEILGLSF